jgi:hypothetical protein
MCLLDQNNAVKILFTLPEQLSKVFYCEVLTHSSSHLDQCEPENQNKTKIAVLFTL